MKLLIEVMNKLLRDVNLFIWVANGLKLRKYQEFVARSVVHSALQGLGRSFVVIFPRQSGKNELRRRSRPTC